MGGGVGGNSSSSSPSVKPRPPRRRPRPGGGKRVFSGLLALRAPARVLRSSASTFNYVFLKLLLLLLLFAPALFRECSGAAPWTKEAPGLRETPCSPAALSGDVQPRYAEPSGAGASHGWLTPKRHCPSVPGPAGRSGPPTLRSRVSHPARPPATVTVSFLCLRPCGCLVS